MSYKLKKGGGGGEGGKQTSKQDKEPGTSIKI